MSVDLLIVTALTEEAQVVNAVLSNVAVEKAKDRDGLSYFDFKLGDMRQAQLVTACVHEMGATAMGNRVPFYLNKLRPNAAVLIVIAAAVNIAEIAIGDVPFASHVFSYDNIAVKAGQLEFRSQGYPVDHIMHEAIGALRTDFNEYGMWQSDCITTIGTILNKVNETRRVKATIPSDFSRIKPHIHSEILGGGPFLIRDEGFRNALFNVPQTDKVPNISFVSPIHPKLAVVEMESHGFMLAAHRCGIPASVINPDYSRIE